MHSIVMKQPLLNKQYYVDVIFQIDQLSRPQITTFSKQS